MKQNPTIAQPGSNMGRTAPVRFPFFALTCVVLLIGIGTFIFLANRSKPADEKPVTSVSKTPSADEVVETTGNSARPSGTTERSVPRNPRRRGTTDSNPDLLPAARQLVASLSQFDFTHGPLTPAKVNAWKESLQQLTAVGAGAVPAIREFLEQNRDLVFDPTTANLLGQGSVRLSMLEALANIGGPEAIALSSQTLQTTLDPREIAWIAQSLEQQAPGEYGEMALQAAQDALAAAEANQLEGRDVGPVFGVLHRFGGDDTVTHLEKLSDQYQYYAPMALAKMPDGLGIQSLIEMVQDQEQASKGGRGPVLEVIAQASLESPRALKELLDQAERNRIPNTTWVGIASILSGNRMEIGSPPPDSGPEVRSFHLATGNQNYYTILDQSQWPPDQVNRYLDIINQLVAASPNPAAAAALEKARAALQARLQ